jgi:hypothetical protein
MKAISVEAEILHLREEDHLSGNSSPCLRREED